MNKNITILLSADLARMRLSELVGRKGTVVEDLTAEGRLNLGYMIKLDEPYMNESLWFIPEDSIEYA